jgi:hypothetical protein
VVAVETRLLVAVEEALVITLGLHITVELVVVLDVTELLVPVRVVELQL